MAKGKSNRFMNPADRERKKQRAQELKKNKKQRTQVRQALVKGRDPEELLAQLRRLDEQDLDPNGELSKHVIADKRGKCLFAYEQQLELYKQEKDENQISRLENMLKAYKVERKRREEHYQAIMFSNDMNLGDIPLPCGSMMPEAAMTPFIPAPPLPPKFDEEQKTQKKPVKKEVKKTPPGPPSGVPPNFDDDLDISRSRKPEYLKQPEAEPDWDDYDVDDDDMGPVPIPDELMPLQSGFPPVRSMVSAPIIPPNMAPPPPPMPPNFVRPSFDPTRRFGGPPPIHKPINTFARPPVPAQRPSLAPPTASGEAVISAAPQMRNFKKETTKFVPAALQVRRPATQFKPKPISRKPVGKPRQQQADTAPAVAGSADKACDDFLREISDLL
ncbi:unnamed protein product [Bursaphelenchus okinawaensis]|uniref:Wbp11/ELF5/Saf1 N-terminal domain-containing protein n=1 Tax=Bursaphelenchus okinawaensis TaxID=465554 RepID=A0A811LCA9_9BILA|nr:unnamed protein product [Bursaphelenchus okinawaensis]CAG9120499.1 unnamed protein product [Bursaphelenchus okinawaensis]